MRAVKTHNRKSPPVNRLPDNRIRRQPQRPGHDKGKQGRLPLQEHRPNQSRQPNHPRLRNLRRAPLRNQKGTGLIVNMSFSGSTRESAKTLTLVELGNDGTVFFLWSAFLGSTAATFTLSRKQAVPRMRAHFLSKQAAKFPKENLRVKIADPNSTPLSRAPLSLRPACGGLAAPPFQSGLGLICNPLFNIRRLSLVYKVSLVQYNYCYTDGSLSR